jgi:hypothetical protein
MCHIMSTVWGRLADRIDPPPDPGTVVQRLHSDELATRLVLMLLGINHGGPHALRWLPGDLKFLKERTDLDLDSISSPYDQARAIIDLCESRLLEIGLGANADLIESRRAVRRHELGGTGLKSPFDGDGDGT